MADKKPQTSMSIEPMPKKPSSEEITPPVAPGYNDGTDRISPSPSAKPGSKARSAIEHGETRNPTIGKITRTSTIARTNPMKMGRA